MYHYYDYLLNIAIAVSITITIFISITATIITITKATGILEFLVRVSQKTKFGAGFSSTFIFRNLF